MCNLRIEDFRPDVCLVELDQQAGNWYQFEFIGIGKWEEWDGVGYDVAGCQKNGLGPCLVQKEYIAFPK